MVVTLQGIQAAVPGDWLLAEIFENGYMTEHPNLHFAHMKILLDSSAEEVSDQITYLYKLEPGRSTASFGTWWVGKIQCNGHVSANNFGETSCAALNGYELMKAQCALNC